MDSHPNRRSIRLSGYDYADPNAYFVTLCAHEKRCVFGEIDNGTMQLNRYGHIVAEEWSKTAEIRPAITLDAWVVMPNHFHAIVVISKPSGDSTPVVGAHSCAPLRPSNLMRKPRSLGSLIAQFKATVTRRINTERALRIPNASPVKVWQRNYYEHIIRDERELLQIRRYIIENPTRWDRDAENPRSKSP